MPIKIMPIKIGPMTFPTFETAIRWVMRKKGFTHERAAGYVTNAEKMEEKLRENKKEAGNG
mgnify:FL=1